MKYVTVPLALTRDVRYPWAGLDLAGMLECRKKKAVHKTTSTDDKRLQNTLKRLGVNTIPGIEEVLLLNNDGTALQFNNPKVQASIAANTYVVSGPAQQKRKCLLLLALFFSEILGASNAD